MMFPPAKKIYVLDTNVLIDFAIWHPISLSKVFWECFALNLDKGNWILVDEVVWEIKSKYQPELAQWCKDAEMAGRVRKISDDNRNRGLAINKLHPIINTASNKSIVDTYLIAFAEENSLTIFTREARKDIGAPLNKIPNVCDALKVDYIREPEVFLNAIGYNS
jgi:Domain of unknown function (DUF4411)